MENFKSKDEVPPSLRRDVDFYHLVLKVTGPAAAGNDQRDELIANPRSPDVILMFADYSSHHAGCRPAPKMRPIELKRCSNETKFLNVSFSDTLNEGRL